MTSLLKLHIPNTNQSPTLKSKYADVVNWMYGTSVGLPAHQTPLPPNFVWWLIITRTQRSIYIYFFKSLKTMRHSSSISTLFVQVVFFCFFLLSFFLIYVLLCICRPGKITLQGSMKTPYRKSVIV